MELVGIILPPIIDLVNQFINNKQIRFLMAFSICAVFGVAVNWLSSQFIFATPMEAFQSLSSSILAVFGSSQVTYNLGYEDSKMQDTIRGK